MSAVRESWTDARLDDFRAETARRFDTLERRMDDGFSRIDARFDALQRTLIVSCSSIAAALLGLIATQL
jgi:hypothetical protein